MKCALLNGVLLLVAAIIVIELKPLSDSFEEDLVDLITHPGEIRSGSTFIYNVREGQYYLEVLGYGNDWSVTFKQQ